MTRIGKRYECRECHTVVLCLKPSPAELECCGKPMGEKQMEELPSGD